ncbi:hypothetical protein [Phocaeicola plebeius]|uniref:hypothetical protein n=1 Tax=Phocaeicola plebeius TaxID=310297 RepID=UPI003AB2BA81
MKKSIEDIYYCAECGSVNTSSMAWVDNRSNKVDEYIGSRLEEENNFCNTCQKHVKLMNLKELWRKFSEVEVNENDEITKDFLSFPAGTDKFAVWHWFDERCPNNLHDDLMV